MKYLEQYSPSGLLEFMESLEEASEKDNIYWVDLLRGYSYHNAIQRIKEKSSDESKEVKLIQKFDTILQIARKFIKLDKFSFELSGTRKPIFSLDFCESHDCELVETLPTQKDTLIIIRYREEDICNSYHILSRYRSAQWDLKGVEILPIFALIDIARIADSIRTGQVPLDYVGSSIFIEYSWLKERMRPKEKQRKGKGDPYSRRSFSYHPNHLYLIPINKFFLSKEFKAFIPPTKSHLIVNPPLGWEEYTDLLRKEWEDNHEKFTRELGFFSIR